MNPERLHYLLALANPLTGSSLVGEPVVTIPAHRPHEGQYCSAYSEEDKLKFGVAKG